MTAEKIAFLWDESFLWGVMASRALEAAGLPFTLLRAEEVRAGGLKDCGLLFVPGGWASNKAKALGPEGMEAIRRFIGSGGSYFGICGGAGLATQDGVGLLEVKRRPTRERVPSFSGRIGLTLTDHAIWRGIAGSVFHAWWPSQFMVDGQAAAVLATYGEALDDSFSSDLNVGDVRGSTGWADLEARYQINLDPERLRGEPAVIEGSYGRGKVMLSLIHFDTPGDSNGAAVLKNIWGFLTAGARAGKAPLPESAGAPAAGPSQKAPALLAALEAEVDGLIEFGIRNFLWFRRTPMLLQWRRGIRGLEYCTLHLLIKELCSLARRGALRPLQIEEPLARIGELLFPFTAAAKRLLSLERSALQSGHITYEKCDDSAIQELRTGLFSSSKSYGGSFKALIDEIDALLYAMLCALLSRQRPA